VSLIRVLVVDDFEPFRRFICTTLGKQPGLHIVGEASDGLEAVQKAEELQPDLILLDMGLPSLSGMGAIQRIRTLAPQSKVLFVSQESTADIVQQALSLGALGYVVKTHAARELLPAVEMVLAGGQFISQGVSGLSLTAAPTLPSSKEGHPVLAPKKQEINWNHRVEFYSDDSAFVVGFSGFIESVLERGNAVILVSTQSNRERMLQKLQENGVDIVAAIERGSYIALDVADMVSSFMEMESNLPDPVRFSTVIDGLIARAARAISGEPSQVAICGECASILWARGKADAAIQMEQLCNQLAKRNQMEILCGFSLSSFDCEEDKQIFEKICSEYRAISHAAK
jgi:DNA-binding NarL/FixJ family response regulator